MAEIRKTYERNGTQERDKDSLDPQDMMMDAVQYAKQAYSTSIALLDKLGVQYEPKIVAKTLVSVKYKQIEDSRKRRSELDDVFADLES
jgi:hypothetical protein